MTHLRVFKKWARGKLPLAATQVTPVDHTLNALASASAWLQQTETPALPAISSGEETSLQRW